MKKRLACALALIGAPLLILASLLPFWALMRTVAGSPFDDKPFDAEVWAASTGNRHSFRAPMAQDLIDRHLKRGMTREQVVQLIGEPDSRSGKDRLGAEYASRHPRLEECFTYHLGRVSGYGTGDDYLILAFESGGHLLEAVIRHE
jgi:hypothetical protein